MHAIITVARFTLKDGLRHRVIYGVFIAALLTVACALLFSGMFMRDISKVILDISLSAISMGALLVPFFLAINMLAGEIEHRTAYSMLSQPISRSQFILGKYAGFLLITAAIVAIFTSATLVAMYGASFLFEPIHLKTFSVQAVLLSVIANFMGVSMLLAASVLWCTATTSSFLATLLTLSTYFIGQTIEEMVRFISSPPPGVNFSPLFKTVIQGILYVFPNLAAFDLKLQAAHGIIAAGESILYLGLYAGSYITVIISLAILFFNKRDLA
ncbi:MAG: ABC transporter permease subunit [Desulfobulbaceae bacterium]|nr:ABC transporter permease subunit [Desulfobulbaceae bacterium]